MNQRFEYTSIAMYGQKTQRRFNWFNVLIYLLTVFAIFTVIEVFFSSDFAHEPWMWQVIMSRRSINDTLIHSID